LATMLFEHNIDQSIKNKRGLTAIEIACELGEGRMVLELIDDRKKRKLRLLARHITNKH